MIPALMAIWTALSGAMMTAAASAPSPATAPALGNDPEAVMKRAMQQYQAARSYEDTVSVLVELDVQGGQIEPPEATQRSIALARPNRFAMHTPVAQVVCDGQKLWESVAIWMQYCEGPAPKELQLKSIELSEFPFFKEVAHPLAKVLLSNGTPSLEFLGGKVKLVDVKPEPLDGVPGRRVRAMVTREAARFEVPVEIWVDDANGLIGEIVYDNTKTVQGAPGIVVNRYVQRYRFKDVHFNQPIGDDRFTFQPGEYIDKVTRLRMPSAFELQQRMVGKPAIDFKGKDLDGKDASMADFKGRVLLLDFWSQRCGPCIMGMPILQRVADRYADKAVSVVGVNLDGPAARDNIAGLIKNRNVKFRQLIQTKPSLSDRYFVEGIPMLVMIDPRGIVQSVHTGLSMDADLGAQIDKLLKGENLYKR